MIFGAFDTFVQNLKSLLIQFLIIVSLSSLSTPKRRLGQTSKSLATSGHQTSGNGVSFRRSAQFPFTTGIRRVTQVRLRPR